MSDEYERRKNKNQKVCVKLQEDIEEHTRINEKNKMEKQ